MHRVTDSKHLPRSWLRLIREITQDQAWGGTLSSRQPDRRTGLCPPPQKRTKESLSTCRAKCLVRTERQPLRSAAGSCRQETGVRREALPREHELQPGAEQRRAQGERPPPQRPCASDRGSFGEKGVSWLTPSQLSSRSSPFGAKILLLALMSFRPAINASQRVKSSVPGWKKRRVNPTGSFQFEVILPSAYTHTA